MSRTETLEAPLLTAREFVAAYLNAVLIHADTRTAASSSTASSPTPRPACAQRSPTTPASSTEPTPTDTWPDSPPPDPPSLSSRTSTSTSTSSPPTSPSCRPNPRPASSNATPRGTSSRSTKSREHLRARQPHPPPEHLFRHPRWDGRPVRRATFSRRRPALRAAPPPAPRPIHPGGWCVCTVAEASAVLCRLVSQGTAFF